MLHEISYSQISSNISLIAQINPDTASSGRFSGCWGYTSPSGNEYAITGSHSGTYVIDISDSANTHVAAFVPGIDAEWREIKVVKGYAYVVSQIFAPGNSMQVIDLSFLPDSVHLAATFDSTFSSAHTIEINNDGFDGFIYVNGPVNAPELGGVHILDISNPVHPVEVGEYSATFIHDCVVKGNLLYAMNTPNQTIDILDISDRSNPKLIGQIACCANVHSGDLTADGNFLFATQEIPKTPAHIFDVRDLSNITEVAQYRGEDSAIVHNAYINSIHAFVANNDGGLRVVDLADPAFPVEVGHYDTYPAPSGIQHGVFTDYPFFSSGKIIATDRDQGLYVFRFNGAKPARVYCRVEDSLTGNSILGANIISSTLTDSSVTDIYGEWKTSFLQGAFSSLDLTVKKSGYYSKSIVRDVSNNADSIEVTFKLSEMRSDSTVTPVFNISSSTANESIRVWNENNSGASASLRLFNMLGELENVFTISENNHPTVIDVSSLPKGIYIAQLSKENELLNEKILIQ